jgi:hypothetical protein
MAWYTAILCLVLLASASRAQEATDGNLLGNNDELNTVDPPVGKQAFQLIFKHISSLSVTKDRKQILA